jgi:hypothetical protein
MGIRVNREVVILNRQIAQKLHYKLRLEGCQGVAYAETLEKSGSGRGTA